MSITAINQFGPEWFTLPGQKDDDQPARVKLQGLDGLGQAELAPELVVDGNSILPTAKGIRVMLQYGVLDWENINDGDGKPLPFPQTAVKRQRALPYDAQQFICNRLFELTFASAEDKKKS